MKTFKIKIEGTPQEITDFVNTLPQEAIAQMSGILPNHQAEEAHRFIQLYSKYVTKTKVEIDWTKFVKENNKGEGEV